MELAKNNPTMAAWSSKDSWTSNGLHCSTQNGSQGTNPSSTNPVTPHTVTPLKKKARRETITQWMDNKHESDKDEDGDGIPAKPAFVKNADMVALLEYFNKVLKLL